MKPAVNITKRCGPILESHRWSSTTAPSQASSTIERVASKSAIDAQPPQPKESAPIRKTQAELDEELREKLAGIAGDGGDAGVEYEDGRPVSMKRGVRENMFRYI